MVEDHNEHNSLFILQSLRPDSESDLLDCEILQHCVLTLAADVYDRMIQPYDEWPFRLAKLLDSGLDMFQKATVATQLFTSPMCCLDDVALYVKLQFPTAEKLLQAEALKFLQVRAGEGAAPPPQCTQRLDCGFVADQNCCSWGGAPPPSPPLALPSLDFESSPAWNNYRVSAICSSIVKSQEPCMG